MQSFANSKKSAQSKQSVPAASVLPYAIRPIKDSPFIYGEIVFLIGQEHKEEGWSGSERWSDFGGRADPRLDASVLDAAARIAYDETMGVLGTKEDIKQAIELNGTMVKSESGDATCYLLPISYNESLPMRFSRAYQYLAQCAVPHRSKRGHIQLKGCPRDVRFFEKLSIAWIPAQILLGTNCREDDALSMWRQTQLRSAFRNHLDTYVASHFDPILPHSSLSPFCHTVPILIDGQFQM